MRSFLFLCTGTKLLLVFEKKNKRRRGSKGIMLEKMNVLIDYGYTRKRAVNYIIFSPILMQCSLNSTTRFIIVFI